MGFSNNVIAGTSDLLAHLPLSFDEFKKNPFFNQSVVSTVLNYPIFNQAVEIRFSKEGKLNDLLTQDYNSNQLIYNGDINAFCGIKTLSGIDPKTGDTRYLKLSIISALLGAVVTVIVCKIIEFFRFCLDYSRTEKVQFEDDEYYYYVKAVPKMTVAAPTNTVKKINTQRRPAGQQTRTSGQGTRPSGQTYRNTAHTGRTTDGTGRSVVTERTPARNGVPYGQQGGYRGHEMSGGRSVTIGGDHTNPQDDSDDYEELF